MVDHKVLKLRFAVESTRVWEFKLKAPLSPLRLGHQGVHWGRSEGKTGCLDPKSKSWVCSYLADGLLRVLELLQHGFS